MVFPGSGGGGKNFKQCCGTDRRDVISNCHKQLNLIKTN